MSRFAGVLRMERERGAMREHDLIIGSLSTAATSYALAAVNMAFSMPAVALESPWDSASPTHSPGQEAWSVSISSENCSGIPQAIAHRSGTTSSCSIRRRQTAGRTDGIPFGRLIESCRIGSIRSAGFPFRSGRRRCSRAPATPTFGTQPPAKPSAPSPTSSRRRRLSS